MLGFRPLPKRRGVPVGILHQLQQDFHVWSVNRTFAGLHLEVIFRQYRLERQVGLHDIQRPPKNVGVVVQGKNDDVAVQNADLLHQNSICPIKSHASIRHSLHNPLAVDNLEHQSAVKIKEPHGASSAVNSAEVRDQFWKTAHPSKNQLPRKRVESVFDVRL